MRAGWRLRDRSAGLIDSHTHLYLCEEPDAELVERAVAAGVVKMLTVGTNGISSRAALASAEAFPQVYASVGCHPNEAHGFDDADLAELEALAEHPRCVAIGETGLDYYRENAAREDQARAFRAQIALARSTGTTLIVHTRDAAQDTLAILAQEAEGLQVVIHCFSMPDRLQECLDRGYAISFAGNVTYKSAADLAEAARLTPAERLLIETDAPYLTPQVVRKHRNQPAYVAHTAAFIAELRGISLDELGATVERNAARVFGW
jgi:TatD DNase family protein